MGAATQGGSIGARTLLFESILNSTKNSKNSETVAVNWVRMLGMPFNGGEYALRNARRCGGMILFDVLPDFGEVNEDRLDSDYSHGGGGNSRFLPQDRNQRATFL